MRSILIENGAVLTVDDAGTLHKPGYVYIEDDTIAAVGCGRGAGNAARRPRHERIDATHMAVMPGMVNAHTHLFQTFLRGLADDKPLLDWLAAAIWPVAQALTEEEAYVAAKLGLVENIRSGATAVIDHQYIHTEPGNDDGVCRAAEEIGRALLAGARLDGHGLPSRVHGDARPDHGGDGHGCMRPGTDAPTTASASSLRRSFRGAARTPPCSAPTRRARRGASAA
jgi:cytosine/adenosine deaminase-related metal-dependent hydrolase